MKQKGFTLIELLVVVAIIGVLASIVLTSLAQARSRARDATRKQNIRTIQTALEVYYLDNGEYPDSGGFSHASWSHSADSASWSALMNELGGQDLPIDPINNTGAGNLATDGFYNYSYFSSPLGIYCGHQKYLLVYNLENENAPTDGELLCNGNVVYGYGNAFVSTNY